MMQKVYTSYSGKAVFVQRHIHTVNHAVNPGQFKDLRQNNLGQKILEQPGAAAYFQQRTFQRKFADLVHPTLVHQANLWFFLPKFACAHSIHQAGVDAKLPSCV
jgi:hypothetical protein